MAEAPEQGVVVECQLSKVSAPAGRSKRWRAAGEAKRARSPGELTLQVPATFLRQVKPGDTLRITVVAAPEKA